MSLNLDLLIHIKSAKRKKTNYSSLIIRYISEADRIIEYLKFDSLMSETFHNILCSFVKNI